MELRKYRLCGFNLACPFACRQLRGTTGEPDVSVRYGSVPDRLSGPWASGAFFQAQPGEFLFKLEGVARFLVRAGDEIIVDPFPGAHEDQLSLFLLSACLPVLLHQRGRLLPLHASAVCRNGGALLFTGFSGSGKSTLLAALMQRGYSMMADDIAAVSTMGAEPLVVPSFPYLKLWPDTISQLAYEARPTHLLRPGLKKRGCNIRDGFVEEESIPIRCIYVLANASQGVSIQNLDNAARLRTLVHHTAGMAFLDGLGLRRAHFELAVSLIRRVAMKSINRSMDDAGLETILRIIEKDQEGAAA
jgi:hypothetical protein